MCCMLALFPPLLTFDGIGLTAEGVPASHLACWFLDLSDSNIYGWWVLAIGIRVIINHDGIEPLDLVTDLGA